MFKKLKHRLLYLNVILITVLITIAFSSIFILTKNRTNGEIDNELHKASNFNPNSSRPEQSTDESLPQTIPNGLIPDRLISFTLNIDDEDNLLSVLSYFDEEDVFYETALSLSLNSTEGRIILDDTEWAFQAVARKDHNQVVFIDITRQMDMLSRLAYTFIGTSIVMLLLTFILSNYLTAQSIKPIKSAFNKQNQFISDASHELKTPLTVINTNVDVLLQDYKGTENEKWLKYIQTEVTRMSQLTENLLYLSKFENVDATTSNEIVNVSDLSEHLLLGLEAVAFEKKIQLDYTVAPDLKTSGHPEQLSQVMMILLDNAMKYTADNGYVHFNLTGSPSHIYITVKNNGAGITEENLPKIFDRFYKQDHSRQNTNKGYGLGLAIAQTIVNKHKGKITCISEANKETCFTVKLHKL